MPFHLPAVEPALTFFSKNSACYLLSPLSFARLHTLFVWSPALFPQSFSSLHLLRVDGTRCCFGVCVPALPCEALVPQPCVHHSRGEALFPQGFGQRLHVITGLVLRGPSLLAVYLGSSQSALDCFALQAVAAYADPAPRGQRAPLDEFRALLIDQSAELVRSFLPSRTKTWRRSREHQSSAHAADSSRDSSRGSRR